MKQSIRLVIIGKVQGVFYRASAKNEAIKLGLKGWVKNRPDGSVEAVACGDAEAIQKFIAWCRRGPSSAKVEEVVIEEIPFENFEDFKIVR
jgi:acylphosphatase